LRVTTTPAKSRAVLNGISSRAWEHPADRGALVALRKLRGFDSLLKMLSGLINERATRLLYLGSAVRADERQLTALHRLLTDVGRTLDASELPELYVVNSPVTSAMTIGMDKPIIVLNSSLLELFDEEELRFVVAHELGHALSGHAVYRTLLLRLLAMSGVFGSIPIGSLGYRGILGALYEWQRKSELSADRAGLLAVQDPAIAFRVQMKLASGSADLSQLDQTSFFAQGQEYAESGDMRDAVLRLLLIESRTHPFAVVRAHELRRWVESGDYTRILAGDYPRREDDGQATVSGAAKEAADSYAESFRQSQDAVGKLVHELAGFFGSAKIWIDERLRREG
jgi:Zn-dependent protease with chaperone function